MWEALMMLRLIVAAAPGLTIGRRVPTFAPPAFKDATRLSFAGYRLSLPTLPANLENHDQKIA
ncbi:hypothetical protein SAMN03159463_05324 [Mesorhizobium sp. NFR06]|uniref:hypothetical protein n=1 Tax=Mesorhizobium sp. NFR06 TaxID=1566290 RepID=UPI0008F06E54|nr:hypothetical protein [Mesorhizobium sp. NFR06]SFP98788.1 hypothetical protein SAMN03159463_05324 [Mesorhizobium sp. NFR06]